MKRTTGYLRRISAAALFLLLCLAPAVFSGCGRNSKEDAEAAVTPEVKATGQISVFGESTEEPDAADTENAAAEEAEEHLLSIPYIPLTSVPAYSGESCVKINENTPLFSQKEITSESFEYYCSLDELGRCTAAYGSLSVDTMPGEDEERGSIAAVEPSGWNQAGYDFIESGWLYNRCHLIAWALGAENDNELNLITGTRYLNLEMEAYEKQIASWLRKTGGHVMYRVTPVYSGSELVCRGLLMEALSVEDGGEGICLCLYFYNVQPGVEIDYADGSSKYSGEFADLTSAAVDLAAVPEEALMAIAESAGIEGHGDSTYILNRHTLKIHMPDCAETENISAGNRVELSGISLELLQYIGYSLCGTCFGE